LFVDCCCALPSAIAAADGKIGGFPVASNHSVVSSLCIHHGGPPFEMQGLARWIGVIAAAHIVVAALFGLPPSSPWQGSMG